MERTGGRVVRAISQRDDRRRLLEHMGNAFGRVGRLDGQVAASSFEDAEDGYNHREGALED